MNTENDDKIQEMAEHPDSGAALSPDAQNDLLKYTQLFSLLSREPDLVIPADFSLQIVERIRARQDRKKHAILYIITALLVAAGIFYFFIITPAEIFSLVWNSFYQFRWIALFIIAVIAVIHFVDPKYKMKHFADAR
jgi:hypothetical protein